MDNRTTTQKSPEGQTNQTEQSQHVNTSTSFQHLKVLPTPLSERQAEENQPLITPFQDLRALPISLSHSQCVQYKHELLICGGKNKSVCYSYHTIENEYRFIIIALYQIQKMGKDKKRLKQIKEIMKCCCFVKRQDYQLNMMKIKILFNFVNYLFVMILHHYLNDMCVSVIPFCSLVDVMLVDVMLQN
ncbi:hypothetical protein RFI_34516 [Reticulomyxa filosa]|uniref:Uncharacterized protein n=1 Tax=Reticulomyxa filosa TaxID=46433 RepID=X6LP48_RETFI|nr:hypothetical protein RFI_34516 [Reticulomyxa filosa]|eukprot:ETO02897.1 hypothetical protein RFI_34516 [Reticulomyxa filosa]